MSQYVLMVISQNHPHICILVVCECVSVFIIYLAVAHSIHNYICIPFNFCVTISLISSRSMHGNNIECDMGMVCGKCNTHTSANKITANSMLFFHLFEMREATTTPTKKEYTRTISITKLAKMNGMGMRKGRAQSTHDRHERC